MRLTIILLLAASLQLSAKGVAQGVTLYMKDAPLEKVFAAIEKQTVYKFTYTTELLDETNRVDVSVKNAALREVLDLCMKGQPVTYEIIDKAIVIRKKKNQNRLVTANENEGPPIDVHGRVIDENGKPVVVSIIVKGTNKGTTTNENGRFELSNIDQNAILIISGVSIKTIEWKVDGKTELSIITKMKETILDNIQVQVATGYQKVNKERFVGSFSQLDSAAFYRREGMGIIERLDGTITSVLFDKKGASNPIQIRGISTLGGASGPGSILFKQLIIVDNFPYEEDISTINPNDVENITVLKDAVATSIWGARAGNGVIVITTKKGRYNQPLRISVRSNVKITEKPDLFFFPRVSISDVVDLQKYLFNKGYYDADINNVTAHPNISPVVEILNRLRNGNISQGQAEAEINSFKKLDIRNDLNNYVYQKSIAQQHYINFSGGNSLMNYIFSIGYNSVEPNIQGAKSSDNQYTININNSFRPLKNLEIQAGLNLSQQIFYNTSFNLPNYPYAQLADVQGNPLAIPYLFRTAYLDTIGGGQLLDWQYRPLEEIALSDDSKKIRYIQINLIAQYRFASWLNGNLEYRCNQTINNTRKYFSQQTYYARDLINKFTNLTQNNPDLRYVVPRGGILSVSNNQSSSYNIRGQLNVNKNFGAAHTFSGLAAFEVSENNGGSGSSNLFYGYDNRSITYKSNIDYANQFPLITNGSARIPSSQSYSEGFINRFFSLIANASYNYKGRYTIYASARKDGSNLYGVNTNNRWKPLWSTGVKWDLSKETFYSLKLIPSFSLRISYGYSGNSGGASASPIISYYPNAPITGLQFAQFLTPPNPDLKWELVKIINLGIDFILLENRISGSIDFYNKKSTDLINRVPVDPTTGVLLFTENAASLKGYGFEASVNSKNTSGELKWETRLGLSHAVTIVTKVYNGGFKASDFITYTLHPSVGKQAYGIAAYRWAGLDPLTGDPQGWLNGKISKNYTGIFNDLIENQVFKGSSIPLYSGYINNTFTWRNFSVSSNITGRFDFYFRKPSIRYGSLFGNLKGSSEYYLRWQKPGDEAYTSVPSLVYPSNSNRDQFYSNSEVNVLRGDNIRIQDVQFQYNWRNKSVKHYVKNVQTSIYINNLNILIWRANTSIYDPDFESGNTSSPPEKTFAIGFGINF